MGVGSNHYDVVVRFVRALQVPMLEGLLACFMPAAYFSRSVREDFRWTISYSSIYIGACCILIACGSIDEPLLVTGVPYMTMKSFQANCEERNSISTCLASQLVRL